MADATLDPARPFENTRGRAAPAVAPYRWLLLFRFALVNLVGLALVAASWAQGWLEPVIATDTTHLCAVITGVFLLGLGLATRRVAMLSYELNVLDGAPAEAPSKVALFRADAWGRDAQARANLILALRLKLGQRLSPIRHLASTLVLLGLIGTVVGFIIALGGVDPQTAADVAAIPAMVSTLIEGMSVALYTTLVGSVLNIWLMLNYRLLEGGAVHLTTRLVELGERHADR